MTVSVRVRLYHYAPDTRKMPGCACRARHGLVQRPPPCARYNDRTLERLPVITRRVGAVSGGLPDASGLVAQALEPFCRVSGNMETHALTTEVPRWRRHGHQGPPHQETAERRGTSGREYWTIRPTVV
jgi:hypothetical protein